MIIDPTSPLLRLPGNLLPRQAASLDGFRLAAAMTDIAHRRLCEHLAGVTGPESITPPRCASLFLDAWSIVDSVHRIREVLCQMPNLKQSTPTFQSFIRGTSGAPRLRNTVQHLRQELERMSTGQSPVWGTLSWLALLTRDGRGVASRSITPGRVLTQTQPVLNPVGKQFHGPVDHITLRCRGHELCLSDSFRHVTTVVRWHERILGRQFPGTGSTASDFFTSVMFELGHVDAKSTESGGWH